LENYHSPKTVEVRHRLVTDVIEFPEDLQHLRAEIGA
jgi:hypothetical protein